MKQKETALKKKAAAVFSYRQGHYETGRCKEDDGGIATLPVLAAVLVSITDPVLCNDVQDAGSVKWW